MECAMTMSDTKEPPHYRIVMGSCPSCIHSYWETVQGPWMCDKYKREVDPNGVCDDYE